MVFALDGGDRLLCVRAPNRFRPHFAQAEAFHLAFANKIPDGSGHIFDGHFGVETMLIKKFDGIDLQPPFLDVVWPAFFFLGLKADLL